MLRTGESGGRRCAAPEGLLQVALEVFAGRLALHAARGAGEEAQVVDHGRDLVALEGLDRLAGVGRLELGDLVGALLERIKVELDKYWDLLRQRRARERAGLDPDDASLRDADTVERYLQ